MSNRLDRPSITIDTDLHEAAKDYARSQHRSFSSYVTVLVERDLIANGRWQAAVDPQAMKQKARQTLRAAR